VGELPAGTDPETLTQRRRARAILVVPERTAARLERGAAGHVQLIVDGADANTATALLGYAEAIVAARNAAAARARLPNVAALDSTALDYRPRVLFNPELKSTQFLVPGLIGFILMLTAVLSTALSVVREKERGTMEQLRVTSLRPAELIVGKTFPYLGISLAATLLILIAARVLFGVEIRGPYLDLFVATLVYLVGALGYGLVISSLADTQAFAFQVGAVSSILPAILLSGFIFPIESMPPVLQAITYAVPARYFNVILRGVILKGVGLGPYLRDLGFLILYAVVVLGIAYARLRRREG
jgi:ABC-2 type transport system permease protein